MGFFNKQDTPTSGLEPLSPARIKAGLEGLGWRYEVDSDGDIGAGWDDGLFYFLQRGKSGEIFYVRGLWWVKLTEAELARADEICAEWNRETIWPKAYTHTADGVVRVACEHSVDYEFGLTNQQLAQHLKCVVSTGSQLFEKLNEEFPEQYQASQTE